MTALKKYQKLESPGLWRDTPEAQRREVVVAFGEASLILTDPRSGTALAHWSLPAVVRLNPGIAPALYAPGAEATETLEIDDPTMSGAIETVRSVIEAARPHPGRLRGRLGLAGAAVLAALAVFWLPGALIRSTAAILPPAARAEIGRMALADVMRIAGTPCSGAAGG
ncbi:MAG: hypothetical protein IE927_13730, partial [Rhodobacterales bacterium]|nr:hypothetical protein [Rhodobacterales bacterium]